MLSLTPLMLLTSGCSSWKEILPIEVKTVEVERKIPIQNRPKPMKLNDIHFYVVTEENYEEFKNRFGPILDDIKTDSESFSKFHLASFPIFIFRRLFFVLICFSE